MLAVSLVAVSLLPAQLLAGPAAACRVPAPSCFLAHRRASCGNVENVRMATDQEVTLAFRQPNTGQTFAFVQFEQQESANTALTLTGMQLGERAIKINPAKLPPTLIAHGGKGGDLGAMQKANEVQARLLARMAERKAKEEAEAAAKEEARKAKEARKAAGEESEEEKEEAKKEKDEKKGKDDRSSHRDRCYVCVCVCVCMDGCTCMYERERECVCV